MQAVQESRSSRVQRHNGLWQAKQQSGDQKRVTITLSINKVLGWWAIRPTDAIQVEETWDTKVATFIRKGYSTVYTFDIAFYKSSFKLMEEDTIAL